MAEFFARCAGESHADPLVSHFFMVAAAIVGLDALSHGFGPACEAWKSAKLTKMKLRAFREVVVLVLGVVGLLLVIAAG